MSSISCLTSILVPLLGGGAAASGTLLDTGVQLQSFADASGVTRVSAENDGTWIWTAQGGFTGSNLARYTQAGTLDSVFQPGPDFRSIYTDNSGNLFAKEYGAGNVWSITPAGTGAVLYTLNDPESQSGGGLNGDDTELYTMGSGTVRRYNAANGALLGSFALTGWGSVGNELLYPDSIQMATTGAGRILTYTNGVVSEWDLAGNRVGMCNVVIGTPNGFDTVWSFGVDGAGRVYLYDESTGDWNVYDVGAGGGGGVGTPICFGDGSGSPCGCGNEGPAGAGCLSTIGLGAVLSATGTPSVSSDTLGLSADQVVNQPGLFFQGNNAIGGGTGATFGDGVRCCGNSVVRLQVVNPPGTSSPATAQMTETATTNGPAGTVMPGDQKCYQYWYRDPAGGGVCGSSFNFSNAVLITWLP